MSDDYPFLVLCREAEYTEGTGYTTKDTKTTKTEKQVSSLHKQAVCLIVNVCERHPLALKTLHAFADKQ